MKQVELMLPSLLAVLVWGLIMMTTAVIYHECQESSVLHYGLLIAEVAASIATAIVFCLRALVFAKHTVALNLALSWLLGAILIYVALTVSPAGKGMEFMGTVDYIAAALISSVLFPTLATMTGFVFAWLICVPAEA